jgi:hypothetical protein
LWHKRSRGTHSALGRGARARSGLAVVCACILPGARAPRSSPHARHYRTRKA